MTDGRDISRRQRQETHRALRGGHYCNVQRRFYTVAVLDPARQVWACPGCGAEIPGAEYAHRLRV